MSRVYVCGATGKQGGAVVRAAHETDLVLVAQTRDPGSHKAEWLKRIGVEVVEGDFSDIKSLVKGMRGCDFVFVVATPLEKGVKAETEFAINAFKAAKEAGVKHIIYSSVAGADRNTGIPHFESKYRAEEYLGSMGIDYTIVAPVFFMENIYAPWVIPQLKEGSFALALPPDRKLQMIALDNIGEFVVEVIKDPASFIKKRIEIASDELDGEEVVDVIVAWSACDIHFKQQDLDDLMSNDKDIGLMYKWFNEVGYHADIRKLRNKYSNVKWKTLDEWADLKDWKVLKCTE